MLRIVDILVFDKRKARNHISHFFSLLLIVNGVLFCQYLIMYQWLVKRPTKAREQG